MKLANDNVVIGIDPGPNECAFAVFDGERVLGSNIEDIDATQRRVGFGTSPLRKPWPVFCEMVACYGMPVGKSVFETCVTIGMIKASCYPADRWNIAYRKDIKLHLCHSMRAKDANVRQALIDRLGPQGTKKQPGPTYGVRSHEWAALAVAVYGWDQTFGQSTTNGGRTD